GKSTLFRVLSTLIPLQTGSASILGYDVRTEASQIRRQVGVVFQSPSLDKKLTISENLRCYGRVCGLARGEIRSRSGELLDAMGLADRRGDSVETLSGGMRRRVELAKALMARPRLLLLDEPSTGLDPGARSDLWRYLQQIRNRDGVTVVLTSHLLDEADRADRVAIMDRGRFAALDAPVALRSRVGGDAITIHTDDCTRLAERIRSHFQCEASVVGDVVRMERPDGHQWVGRLVEAFPEEIDSISLGKPTLEDVFIDLTGHRFFGGEEPDVEDNH
ncbi:MAG: ATP-binding cassette domain-containing protein, partial [Planctomycetota bacterium]